MSSVERQVARQISNIERSTGRSLTEWIAIVRRSGLDRHGQLVSMLKQEHGLGHGNASLIVLKAREAAGGGAPTDAQLVETHYSDRNAALRPLYDALVARVLSFGPDVELAPKKSYVSLRRRKQFGQVGPAAGQLEISLNLPGEPATDRLQATSGMATHRVRVTSEAELDDELLGWLREAYERA